MNSLISRWSSNLREPARVKLAINACKSSSAILGSLRLKNDTMVSKCSTSMRALFVDHRLAVSLVYTITLKTGNIIGAGTDANVYVRMIGELGSSDEIMLKTNKGDMERGNLNCYNFGSENVGRLKKLIVRHDNTGFAPGWYLEWVRVRDGKGKNYNFRCEQWLRKDEHLGNIKLLKEDNYISEDSENLNNDGKEVSQKDPVLSTPSKEEHVELENNKERQSELQDNKEGQSQLEDKIEEQPEDKKKQSEDLPHLPDEMPRSPEELKISPAVRNLKDTYDIDLFSIAPSGRGSRILKGDVLKFMEKENITKKKFTVNMWHAVDAVQKDSKNAIPLNVPQEVPFESVSKKTTLSIPGDTPLNVAPKKIPFDTFPKIELKKQTKKQKHVEKEIQPTETIYSDRAILIDKQLLNNELQMSKFEVPHLYMSTSCNVDKLQTVIKDLEYKYATTTIEIVLARILSRSLISTNSILSEDDAVDILVTRNGNSITLKNCNDADVASIFKQYERSFEPVDTLTLPRYGINIIDAEGVSQLSSVLRFGQIISLNYGGIRLGIDENGQIVKSVEVAISCDSRLVSEEECGLLLLNCKHYLSNPNTLIL